MSDVNGARLDALLNGIPLPAPRDEVVAYARAEDGTPEEIAALRGLPDGRYESIDDVVEALFPVQPRRQEVGLPVPRPESGEPPGGAAYTR